jgi:hypothetical protein
MLNMQGKTLLRAKYVKDELSPIGCRVNVFCDAFELELPVVAPLLVSVNIF